MPINNDPLQISPYQSTVPLVQLPVDAAAGSGIQPNPPVQGAFRGTGAWKMALGDALLKGFMQGHAFKEQRKNAQAQATINAADAATSAAYQQYQDALTQASGNVKDEKAQAAYTAYLQAFEASKKAKAQFVIPEKPQKGQSSQQKKGEKGEKKTGWSNFKDFFEANPHIVPQIALMTMQPNPPGLNTQSQQEVQNIEQTRIANEQQQRKSDAEKNYQAGAPLYLRANRDSLPDETPQTPPGTATKQGYDRWQASRDFLQGFKYTGTQATYKVTDPNTGEVSYQRMYEQEAAENPYAQLVPPGEREARPGTEQAFFESAYRQYGVNQNNAPPGLQKYLHDYWQWKQSNQPGTTSTSTTDVAGNRTTTTKKNPVSAPKPEDYGLPSGWAYRDGDQQSSPAAGGIGPPPKAGGPSTTQGVPANAPQGSTQFTVGAKPKGMVEEGNLPIWNRPTVQNGDGSHSSEYSTSFEQDGKEVLVPTVVNGKFLTPDGKKPKPGSPEEKAMFKAAWQHYLDTGENLGKFDNTNDADAYAEKLHSRGERGAGRIGPPPKTSAALQGGIAPPPGRGQTWQSSQRLLAINKQRDDSYRTAEKDFGDTLQKIDKNADPDSQKKQTNDAIMSLVAKKNATENNYRQQLKVAGQPIGEVWIYFAQPDQQGNLTMMQASFPDEQSANKFKQQAGIQ